MTKAWILTLPHTTPPPATRQLSTPSPHPLLPHPLQYTHLQGKRDPSTHPPLLHLAFKVRDTTQPTLIPGNVLHPLIRSGCEGGQTNDHNTLIVGQPCYFHTDDHCPGSYDDWINSGQYPSASSLSICLNLDYSMLVTQRITQHDF